MNLKSHFAFIINAHQSHPKKRGNAFRSWDQKTPYSIHPIWCAMTILTETALPRKLREEGYITLLYHDVIEDTTKKLPSSFNKNIYALIRDMTYQGGINEEMKQIWDKSPKIRLLKLYDKISNLLDASWMTPQKKKIYQQYTKKLLKDVKSNYGELNITKIAQGVLNI